MNRIYSSTCKMFESAADICVGYERTIYTTPEGDVSVELCAIIYEPDTGVAPRPFVISYVTAASEYSHLILHILSHSSK